MKNLHPYYLLSPLNQKKEKKGKDKVASDDSPCVIGQTDGSSRDSEHGKEKMVTWKDIVIGKEHVSRG